MASCGYQCTEIPSHEQVVCGEYLKGGQNSIGILECTHSITDFSSADQLLAAIASGDLKLIEPVVAEIPAASPVEGSNPSGCGSATILDSFDRTITWTDNNVTSFNLCDFYPALNRRKAHLIVYHCNAQMITVVDQPVTFVAFRISPANEREKQSFQVVAKWTNMGEACMYDAPDGVFAQNDL